MIDPDADPVEAAREIVLRRLAAAPKTRKDLADDLAQRGIDDAVIERVLNRFTEVGLIDDADYARQWVSNRHRSKGTTRASLRYELRAKGVSDEDGLEAIGAIDDEAERARGVALVTSKLSATARLEPKARARRLQTLLLRRGYRHGEAASIVNEVLGEDLPL